MEGFLRFLGVVSIIGAGALALILQFGAAAALFGAGVSFLAYSAIIEHLAAIRASAGSVENLIGEHLYKAAESQGRANER